MTNGICEGDEVFVPPYTRGIVVEIDEHPFEYSRLKLRCLGAAGEFEVWVSSRLAKKV